MILWKFGQANNPIQEAEFEYFKSSHFLKDKFYICAKKDEDCFCPVGSTIRFIALHFTNGFYLSAPV